MHYPFLFILPNKLNERVNDETLLFWMTKFELGAAKWLHVFMQHKNIWSFSRLSRHAVWS